jgi:hypothetical protein
MTWMLQAIYRRLKYDNLLGNSKNQVQKSFSRPPGSPPASAPPFREGQETRQPEDPGKMKRREVPSLRAS